MKVTKYLERHQLKGIQEWNEKILKIERKYKFYWIQYKVFESLNQVLFHILCQLTTCFFNTTQSQFSIL